MGQRLGPTGEAARSEDSPRNPPHDASPVLGDLRATRQRVAVLQTVKQLQKFAGARTVHAAIRAAGHPIGLSTVYRSLHALVEVGSIDAVRDRHGETVYRACVGPSHHHILCRQCGAAVEIPDEPIQMHVDEWAGRSGFGEVSFTVTIDGLCPTCLIQQ